MKILVTQLFPKYTFVVCTYCGELFGFTEDEIDVFKSEKETQITIPTITCPKCGKLSLLSPKPINADECLEEGWEEEDVDE